MSESLKAPRACGKISATQMDGKSNGSVMYRKPLPGGRAFDQGNLDQTAINRLEPGQQQQRNK